MGAAVAAVSAVTAAGASAEGMAFAEAAAFEASFAPVCGMMRPGTEASALVGAALVRDARHRLGRDDGILGVELPIR
jgi:hypothetical protein